MKVLSRKGKPNKVNSDYTLCDIYKEYVKNFNFPKTQSKFLGNSTLEPVSKEKFRKINARLYQLIFEDMLDKSITVTLPFKLGDMRVQKKLIPISYLRERHKLKVDYAHWRKTGRIKYHLNEHRNYHRYRLLWHRANVENVRSYRLEPIRKWHRKLAKILITNPAVDYFE